MPGASARYSCIGCRCGILVLCVGTVWVWRHEETLSRPTVEATDRQSDRPSKRPTVEATDRRSDRPRKRPTVEAVSKACAAVEAGSSVCTSLPAISWRLAWNVLKPYNCHQIHGFPLTRLFHVAARLGGWHGLLMPCASARYSCTMCRYGMLVLCVGTVGGMAWLIGAMVTGTVCL